MNTLMCYFNMYMYYVSKSLKSNKIMISCSAKTNKADICCYRYLEKLDDAGSDSDSELGDDNMKDDKIKQIEITYILPLHLNM